MNELRGFFLLHYIHIKYINTYIKYPNEMKKKKRKIKIFTSEKNWKKISFTSCSGEPFLADGDSSFLISFSSRGSSLGAGLGVPGEAFGGSTVDFGGATDGLADSLLFWLFLTAFLYCVRQGSEQNSFLPPCIGSTYFNTCFGSWTFVFIYNFFHKVFINYFNRIGVFLLSDISHLKKRIYKINQL